MLKYLNRIQTTSQQEQRQNQEDLNEMALMVVNLLKNSTLCEAELRKEFSQLGARVNSMLTSSSSYLEKKAS